MMRVEGVVYQIPDHYKNRGTKQPSPEAGEKEPRYGEHAEKQTDDLKNSQAQLEKQREAEKASRSLLERNRAAEKENSQQQKFEEAVQKMNERAEREQISLRFRLHDGSKRWMVQIFDVIEDEVVRVIPPEELLDLSAQIQKLTGVLLDERR
jgi:flagellar protein FlaG